MLVPAALFWERTASSHSIIWATVARAEKAAKGARVEKAAMASTEASAAQAETVFRLDLAALEVSAEEAETC
jgi:hypothetical protein